MVLQSALDNWFNGNYSDLDKSALIQIAKYFENAADCGYEVAEELIEDDTD